MKNREIPFIKLPWELVALCCGRFSVVNAIGNVIVRPDKLGTSPMAHGGFDGNCSGNHEKGESNPVSKHQI